MPVATGIGGLKAQGLPFFYFDSTFKKTSFMGFCEFADIYPAQGANG